MSGHRYLTTAEAVEHCRYPSDKHLLRAESKGWIRARVRGRTKLWAREELDYLIAHESRLQLGTWVYFIEAIGANRIKIGFAKNPELRLVEFSTGSAFPLRLLVKVPGGWIEEHELHERFASDRVHGEWFLASKALRTFIAEAAR